MNHHTYTTRHAVVLQTQGKFICTNTRDDKYVDKAIIHF